VPAATIVGGGLAGLSCAAALGEAGFEVDLYEARPFLGGRATSYEVPSSQDIIDNCQHVLLGCCRNLMDFYRRLGVESKVAFHRRYTFIEPGGRTSVLQSRALPAPLHFAGSFLTLPFLSASDKLAIARALAAVLREHGRRADLNAISMAEWLAEKRQPHGAIDRLWRPVLVSAVNEELDRMAALHGLQVFRLGFLSGAEASAMGVPAVPLAELYGAGAWSRWPNVRIHLRSPVERIDASKITVLAVPFERAARTAPELGLDLAAWEHSPITGIHLWFDRKVTDLPHAALLDRTIQWLFNKSEGKYVQLVVSASRSLSNMPRGDVVELARRELEEFLPVAKSARLERWHVVKEVHATFSAAPGLRRPGVHTALPNVFLAGDWTDTGWPATMEGAVRSGYLAAEAVAAHAGLSHKFLLPDLN
jgi:zeta-carotene desaturase